MQLGIRLHDTKKLPFEERIANVHELGFACGHLAPGKVISEFPTGGQRRHVLLPARWQCCLRILPKYNSYESPVI